MNDLTRGAANAVKVCMGVDKDDRMVILTDHARKNIADALVAEAEQIGCQVTTLLMEDFVSRPATEFPDELSGRLRELNPTVSFFVATAQQGEVTFRRPYMDQLIYDMKVRHGHMVGIEERLMHEGMTADYLEISRITHRVNEVVKDAREIEVRTPSGTDLRASLDPSKRRWNPCPGIYREPGTWGNLPEGETFTSPMSVDGVIGAEVLGDYFSERYGVLPEPARFEVSGSRVRKVTTEDEVLAKELEGYLGKHENSDRAGEFAIGTNLAVTKLCGNLLQDEKIPGVHVAFGYPYPHETGADWTCPTHLDVVSTRSTIVVDGQFLMRDGKFDI